MSIILIGDGGHAKVVRDAARTFVEVGDNAARKREAMAATRTFATVIHPLAYVAPDASVGEGTVIMAGAVVQPGTVIGRHVIANTNCSIDHDCIIKDFAHIAPGAVLCGGVQVGEGALVGANATVLPGMKVEAWTVVPAGSVVR